MKKPIFTFLLMTIVVLGFAQKGTIGDYERELLLNSWNYATTQLNSTLDGISDAEWTQKPANGGWSAAECMEHIVISMPKQVSQLKMTLDGSADDSKNLVANDGYVLMKIFDRGKKFKTPLPPEMGNLSRESMLKTYNETGQQFLEILMNEKAEFRNHFGKAPFGEVDAYQLMILIPGHVLRHLNQIEEVLSEIRA
ncbi:MAG: DinB family protein [Cyclobacteriaceae bacterium]